jgi:hypothetical protein
MKPIQFKEVNYKTNFILVLAAMLLGASGAIERAYVTSIT